MQVNTVATASYNKVVITPNNVHPVDETTRSSVKRLTIPAQISSRTSSPLITYRRIRWMWTAWLRQTFSPPPPVPTTRHRSRWTCQRQICGITLSNSRKVRCWVGLHLVVSNQCWCMINVFHTICEANFCRSFSSYFHVFAFAYWKLEIQNHLSMNLNFRHYIYILMFCLGSSFKKTL